ncbi:DNA cytosine methyltransferase [Acuticoccus sp. MNP-M23]|uniref:DNA cytosine methyltransferase n=1 Tax=Acuticoccus sp. MNP-M23 TaxID=3072793 RepID=UPI0028152BFF|nr:DNA cytosine methyltransferase [Acuticoccus sp. MNP-M23]WMS43104.1 DNA cytosine methyltransferase [Acuticoccus sp. MNP-M23]
MTAGGRQPLIKKEAKTARTLRRATYLFSKKFSLALAVELRHSISMENNTAPKLFIDIFAGCGGLSLGLMRAGWQCSFAIEKNDDAFSTYKHNLIEGRYSSSFKWPKWLEKRAHDIDEIISEYRDELLDLRGKVDLIAGGPPCQGFSSAGRRLHHDPRNKLFERYLDLVNILKPNAILIENVRGFTSDFTKKSSVKNYSLALAERLSLDYDVYQKLYNVSEFGVPQARTRFFLIAHRKGLNAENPFHIIDDVVPTFLRRNNLRNPVTAKEALSSLEISKGGIRASKETKGFMEICPTHSTTSYQKYLSTDCATIDSLRLARHSNEIAKRFEIIIEHSHRIGRLNTVIDGELKGQLGIKKKAIRVLDPDRPSPTITSMPDDLLHYSEPRALTVRENARLQSFPDWFSFKGKYTTGGERRKYEVPRFTQVANAVPPVVAEVFGIALLDIAQKICSQEKSCSAHSSQDRMKLSKLTA